MALYFLSSEQPSPSPVLPVWRTTEMLPIINISRDKRIPATLLPDRLYLPKIDSCLAPTDRLFLFSGSRESPLWSAIVCSFFGTTLFCSRSPFYPLLVYLLVFLSFNCYAPHGAWRSDSHSMAWYSPFAIYFCIISEYVCLLHESTCKGEFGDDVIHFQTRPSLCSRNRRRTGISRRVKEQEQCCVSVHLLTE